MLKKLMALLFITAASTNLLAETKTNTMQTLPWSIRSAGALWYIANPTGTVRITFTVNKTINGRNVPSDPITFYCDKPYTVSAGNSVSCTMSNWVRAEFQVVPQNYHNGADGSYTVS
jgi:hypothetical protein